MDFAACEALIKDFLRIRLAAMGELESGLYNYYAYLARQDGAFMHYDRPIVEFLAKLPRAKRYIDVGAGIGQLSVLLACHHMTAIAVEGDARRAGAAYELLDKVRAADAEVANRLFCVNRWFPAPEVPVDRDTIVIFTNVISDMSDRMERSMLEACSEAGGVVIDLVRFTRARSSLERWNDLIECFRSRGFSEPVEIYSWGQPGESEPASTEPGKIVFFQKTPRPAQESVSMSVPSIDPFLKFARHFRMAGSIRLDHCPVCGSLEIARLWQLPQTRLSKTAHIDSPGSNIHRLYLDYLPTLKVPQDIFCYDICARCESIFRNPKEDDHATYVDDASKVARFRRQGASEFLGAAKTYQSYFPKNTQTVVDAACGAGQVLSLLKELRHAPKVIGLEMSAPSVAFMRSELGIEAHAVDLDRDELDGIIPPGSIDFVIFQEAFEHVRDPTGVLRKLLRMLRSGGRLHFTAQRYGEDNELPIRVGEPIFINDRTVEYLVGQIDAKVYELKKDIKFRVVLEKT